MTAKADAEAFGRRAERRAAWWLRLKGYAVLARRFRSPAGEIDLVAGRPGLVAFVEVKARPDALAGLEALGPRQRRRIVRAAEHFLKLRPELADAELRFDLVVCAPWRLPRHVPDAWRP